MRINKEDNVTFWVEIDTRKISINRDLDTDHYYVADYTTDKPKSDEEEREILKAVRESNTFYMNVCTGTVQSMKDWKDDQLDLGFPLSDLDALVEVAKDNDNDNDWTEI
jgi:hypothetical protein